MTKAILIGIVLISLGAVVILVANGDEENFCYLQDEEIL